MARAGYEPGAAPILWRTLQARGSGGSGLWLSLHPSHDERERSMRVASASLPPAPEAPAIQLAKSEVAGASAYKETLERERVAVVALQHEYQAREEQERRAKEAEAARTRDAEAAKAKADSEALAMRSTSEVRASGGRKLAQSKPVEEQLYDLKQLFVKGLIFKSVYDDKQREILKLN
jgi:hypothetical protein